MDVVKAPAEISPLARMGEVHITVSDLDRSTHYYRETVGLEVLDTARGRAVLGAGGRPLVVLHEVPGARPAPGHTGLYHFALLLPRRVDLARWLAHAARDQVPLAGMADHFVSEALYLTDPDQHGIEIYWDRPRELWEGRVAERMTSQRLDVEGLLGELENQGLDPYAGLPAGTEMGHLHLKVAAIAPTIDFYEGLLGFALTARFGPQAAFLAAGGYHHHLGTNAWESGGAAPPPPGSAALRYATVLLPDGREIDRIVDRLPSSALASAEVGGAPEVVDPSGNRLVLRVLPQS